MSSQKTDSSKPPWHPEASPSAQKPSQARHSSLTSAMQTLPVFMQSPFMNLPAEIRQIVYSIYSCDTYGIDPGLLVVSKKFSNELKDVIRTYRGKTENAPVLVFNGDIFGEVLPSLRELLDEAKGFDQSFRKIQSSKNNSGASRKHNNKRSLWALEVPVNRFSCNLLHPDLLQNSKDADVANFSAFLAKAIPFISELGMAQEINVFVKDGFLLSDILSNIGTMVRYAGMLHSTNVAIKWTLLLPRSENGIVNKKNSKELITLVSEHSSCFKWRFATGQEFDLIGLPPRSNEVQNAELLGPIYAPF